MELPIQATVSGGGGGGRGIQYKIETKNLSYQLQPQLHELNWVSCWRDSNGSKSQKYILKNVDCVAKPGEITAIAGPSGAGKTTLLEVLAGMIPHNRISGRILINDRPMHAPAFRRVSGYVTQDDALFPLLTVEETLLYSARLRIGGDLSVVVARVKALIKELGLERVSGSRIGGNSHRGISGGEKRRVSIGVEVVHDPAVLLIDEPTSGLDSASAFQVVALLKSMVVNQGKTIVLTIHQPGYRILELCDQIVLLWNGTVLHHGSSDLLEERLKLTGHCIPRYVNVLEFAIDITESLVVQGSAVPNELVSTDDNLDKEGQEDKFVYPNSPLEEVLILGQRFCNNIFRTKQLFVARIIQALLAGIVLGTIFMNVNNNDKQTTLQTRLGFFAFTLTFLLSTTTEGLPIFLQERKILMRETSRGAYRVSSYVIANTIVFIPFLLTVALLYSIPVYWLVGLRKEIDGFLYFSAVVWMVVLVANAFVACFSALAPDYIMGNSLIAGIMGAFFLFSGYFISKNDIPCYWIFVHYLSLFKYPFESFLINEYGGETGRRMCVQSVQGTCVLYGDGLLMQQGLKDSEKWSNLGVMLGFTFGYRVLCFLILWYRCTKTRN